MPLVRIDVLSESNAGKLPAIGEAVHQAMTETTDVPHGDGVGQMLPKAVAR